MSLSRISLWFHQAVWECLAADTLVCGCESWIVAVEPPGQQCCLNPSLCVSAKQNPCSKQNAFSGNWCRWMFALALLIIWPFSAWLSLALTAAVKLFQSQHSLNMALNCFFSFAVSESLQVDKFEEYGYTFIAPRWVELQIISHA